VEPSQELREVGLDRAFVRDLQALDADVDFADGDSERGRDDVIERLRSIDTARERVADEGIDSGREPAARKFKLDQEYLEPPGRTVPVVGQEPAHPQGLAQGLKVKGTLPFI